MDIDKYAIYWRTQVYGVLYEQWGQHIADRIIEEADESLERAGRFVPTYYVAVNRDPNNPTPPEVLGFAGYVHSHIMHSVYELNGIAVAKRHRGKGVGKALTDKRIEDIISLGGKMVMLMTKKSLFFEKFGFRSVYVQNGLCLMTRKLGELEFD